MEKYIPDIYQKSIYAINYEDLHNNGIKCLLFDLNNTLAPISIKKPTNKTIQLFSELKQMGFAIIIISNCFKRRVKIFSDKLGVDGYSFARKPKINKVLKVMNTYKYDISEVAIIGDQMLTDIVCGNNIGITSILVNPLSTKDSFFTKINRHFEKKKINKLSKFGLFYKGKYYE